MHFLKIRKIAKDKGITLGKLSKVNLVRRIQRKEGNFDCYGTAFSGECDQQDCCWREDCLKASAAISA
ncbi:MAG: SAP domain-containing protein [Gammaproteobacteria bacterium]|nr:SAP domain-containing protein [Gammaproteobacteria bacterium]MCK5092244.1 SAP domain-containing protein [Gammaproteobacteria bacterium]